MRKAPALCLIALLSTACGRGSLDTPTDGATPALGGDTGGADPSEPPPPQHCVSSGAADVNVSVTATKGPKGFAQPIPISNNLYSMGIDDQTREDFSPSLNAKFVSYLKALRPGLLRFPA